MVQVARFLTALPFLFLLAASSIATVNAVAAVTANTKEGICVAAADLHDHVSPISEEKPTKRFTNAERLSRGLTPMKPKRLYTGCESELYILRNSRHTFTLCVSRVAHRPPFRISLQHMFK